MSIAHNQCVLTDNFMYKELLISENKYLVGVRKKNDLRQVLITNLTEFYEENLSKEEICKRCEDLNPVLCDFDIEEIIDDLLFNIPKYAVSSSLDSIQLENIIEDGRFRFQINLTKCGSEYFYDTFMENLYFSFSELHRRYSCLLDIIKKKDQEIAEYKTQGVELLRKSLITEPFNENVFQTKLKNTKPVNKISAFLDTRNFYDSVKDLQFEGDHIKQESIVIKTESCDDEDQSQKKSIGNEASIKRSLSNDMRCAVAPKLENRVKISKQNNDFTFL